jgi:hypothetical protein
MRRARLSSRRPLDQRMRPVVAAEIATLIVSAACVSIDAAGP